MTDTDVLLLAVADVERDARTLNLAHALRASGLRVVVHGEPKGAEAHRAIVRWWKFGRAVAKLPIRPRVVVAMDLFALSAARTMAQRCGARLLYDMREFYFALGPLAGKGFRQRILAAHERRMLADVDDVFVSGELDADIVHERFALPHRPVVLLNTPPYRDVVPSPLRERLGVGPDVFVAVYQGVVHHGRGLAPFLDAMPHLPDVHLAIIGSGPASADIRAHAAALGLTDRVSHLGAVPYADLHALTCGADLGLCLIEPVSMSYEYALPNKLFEYMMARVPCLATDLPALHDHLLRYPVGILVERGLSPAAIADAVRKVQQPATMMAMKGACEHVRDLAYESTCRTALRLIRDHCA